MCSLFLADVAGTDHKPIVLQWSVHIRGRNAKSVTMARKTSRKYKRRSRRVMRKYNIRKRRSSRRRPNRRYRVASKRSSRPEWKKSEDYISVQSIGSIFTTSDQSSATPVYYLAPRTQGPITLGPSVVNRIGNRLGRCVWKVRWCASLQHAYSPNQIGNGWINTNMTAFLRVICYQFKRGRGEYNPHATNDQDAFNYHPVNLPNTGSWQRLSSAQRTRFFTENEANTDGSDTAIPIQMARFRVNIGDEIRIMHDRTYTFSTQGRSTMSKRWKFNVVSLKWDEGNNSNETNNYPQNDIKIIFFLVFPFHNVVGDSILYDDSTFRIDFSSQLRFTDN